MRYHHKKKIPPGEPAGIFLTLKTTNIIMLILIQHHIRNTVVNGLPGLLKKFVKSNINLF